MKREDLQAFSGFLVSLINVETPTMAELHSEDPQRAYLTLPHSSTWTPEHPYYLTDEDIAAMSVTGPHTLGSQVVLRASPGRS